MNKIGIDTNVLLRLIVSDNEKQHQAVLRFGSGIGRDYSGFITVISLVEMDWALRKQYGFTKRDSMEAIRRITRIRGVEVQSHDSVVLALQGVEDGHGELSDLLIAHICLDAGCSEIVTLDRDVANKVPPAVLLS